MAQSGGQFGQHLLKLDLSHCTKVGDACLTQLEQFPKLRVLVVDAESPISYDCVMNLKCKMPELKVIRSVNVNGDLMLVEFSK